MQKSKRSKVLHTLKAFILPLGVYLILLLVTGARFGNGASMYNLLRTSMVSVMIGLSMAFTMDMGMWNFATGAVVYAAAILGANLAEITGLGIPGMCIFTILVALVLNILTGILYNLLRIPALVLSLGLTMVFEALPSIIVKDSTGSINLMDAYLANPPWSFLIVAVMFLIFFYITNFTSLGADMKAIGSNIALANNAGVNIDRVKFIAFVLSGLFMGVTAILYMSTNVSVRAVYGFQSVGIIYDGMMGIFVATVLSKYINYSASVIIGIFTIRMLSSGLVALGLNAQMRTISTGVFLFAVLVYSANAFLPEEIKRKKRIAAEANAQLESRS